MSETLSPRTSIGTFVLGAALVVGALAPFPAQAGEMLMYNFFREDLALITPDGQPALYTQTDGNGQDHMLAVTAGHTPVNASNTASVTQVPFTGLGVCSFNNAIACGILENVVAPQVDSINDNEYLRLRLPDQTELVKSIVVGLVTPIASPADSVAIYGAHSFFGAGATNLLNDLVMNVGTNLGLGFWNIDLGYTGYEYLFLATGQGMGPNDGYSLAQLTIDVPEPAALAIFGLGLAGLGFARRRMRTA